MPVNILLIDDEVEVHEKFKECIKGFTTNFCIHYANSSEQAFEVMNQFDIDIFIVDYVIKDSLNGDQIISYINNLDVYKNKFKNSKIVFMTGTLNSFKKDVSLDFLKLRIDETHDKRNGYHLLVAMVLDLCRKNRLLSDDFNIKHAEDDVVYDYSKQDWFLKAMPEFIDMSYDKAVSQYSIDALLVVVNTNEFKSTIKCFDPVENNKIYRVDKGGATYYLGKMGAKFVLLARCQMGSISPGGSAQVVRTCIELWKPKAAIQLGVCFAKSKKFAPGDVVVSEKLFFYEDMRIGTEEIWRGSKPDADSRLVSCFFHASQEWEFRRPDDSTVNVHIGPVISGQKLVDDVEFKRDLFFIAGDAIAGEMEGAGLYSSASSKIPWIVVKGVSDWGDGKKHKDYQLLAAVTAVSLVKIALNRISF